MSRTLRTVTHLTIAALVALGMLAGSLAMGSIGSGHSATALAKGNGPGTVPRGGQTGSQSSRPGFGCGDQNHTHTGR